jgi:hypothetical protein
MNQTISHLHIFYWIFKSKIIWIKFSIFRRSKILPCFYFFFHFFCLYSLFYLSDPSHTLNHNFFIGSINSSAQSRIQPTDSIFFRHFRPPAASHHLRPLRLPHRFSLCHLPLALWSCLTSSPSSPPKMATPHHLFFPISISRNRWH